MCALSLHCAQTLDSQGLHELYPHPLTDHSQRESNNLILCLKNSCQASEQAPGPFPILHAKQVHTLNTFSSGFIMAQMQPVVGTSFLSKAVMCLVICATMHTGQWLHTALHTCQIYANHRDVRGHRMSKNTNCAARSIRLLDKSL